MSQVATESSSLLTLGRMAVGASWTLALIAFAAAIAARAKLQDVPQAGDSNQGVMIVAVCSVLAAVFWMGIASVGNRVTSRIGVSGLAMIGLVSAIHFAIAVTSRMGGQVVSAVIGPFAVFVNGIGDEGFPCLLSAVLVALRPKVGTLTLSLLSVFLLMVVTSGTLGLTALIFVSTSVALHEGLCALLRVTTGNDRYAASAKIPTGWMLRAALAISLANALALYAQFAFFRQLYRLQFSDWYVAAVVLINGLLLGFIGSVFGARLGYRLRSVAS